MLLSVAAAICDDGGGGGVVASRAASMRGELSTFSKACFFIYRDMCVRHLSSSASKGNLQNVDLGKRISAAASERGDYFSSMIIDGLGETSDCFAFALSSNYEAAKVPFYSLFRPRGHEM